MPWGLDLRQPNLPDALALCRHLAPRGADDRLTEYGNYAWTDLTWLLHRHGVSWRYYIHSGQPPEPPWSSTPEIWNPLPSFTTVRHDGQVGNVKDVAHFLATSSVDSAWTRARTGGPTRGPDVRENAKVLRDLAADFDFRRRPRPPYPLPLNPAPGPASSVRF
jgi:hypothetical protein